MSRGAFRKFIFTLCFIVFCVSGWMLLKILVIDRVQNNRSVDKVRQIYYDVNDDPLKGLRDLSLQYPDMKGWITVPDTKIDYPVMVSSDDKDPQYYLNHDYKGGDTRYGAIFADKRCQDLPNTKSIVLYGHHMLDESMFSSVVNFTKLDYYKARPVFTFNFLQEEASWKVFSVFRTNTLKIHGPVFNYIRAEFNDSEDFMSFIKEIQDRSLICTTVDVNENDQIVLLSTCSYEFENFRTVLVARKVRKDENKTVDVNNARINPNPILPQCYNS